MSSRLYTEGIFRVSFARWFLVAITAAAAPGDKRWELALGACIFGAPTLATNGDVLVATCEGSLQAVTPSGTVRWSFPTTGGWLATPTVADNGTIYFGADKLYVLNPAGTLIWEYATGARYSGSAYNRTAPVSGPDEAVVAAGNVSNGGQGLFALHPDGPLSWSLKERVRA